MAVFFDIFVIGSIAGVVSALARALGLVSEIVSIGFGLATLGAVILSRGALEWSIAYFLSTAVAVITLSAHPPELASTIAWFGGVRTLMLALAWLVYGRASESDATRAGLTADPVGE